MPSPSYFEDFEVGAIQEFGEYKVTEKEICWKEHDLGQILHLPGHRGRFAPNH